MTGRKICIFCQKSDMKFGTEEHIIPESLGNNSGRHVLAPGIVCDSCNNYFSHSVEAPILGHISFQNIRGKYQVPTKRGKIPFVKGYAQGTDIEVGMRLNKKTKGIDIFPTKNGQKKEFDRLSRLDAFHIRQNIFVFPMDVSPPKKPMSRFLAKMAFEALFARFSHISGHEQALDMVLGEHYDNIRNWARYGTSFRDWPYHYRAYLPEETLMEHPETKKWVQFGFGYDLLLTEHPETYFVFSYYGHEFAINVGGPSIKGYEGWLTANRHVSFLVEKKSLYLHSSLDRGETKHFLVPFLRLPPPNSANR